MTQHMDSYKQCNVYDNQDVSDNIISGNRARKSRTTLQNKVRLKVLPEQLTLFLTRLWHSKNASINMFLLYRPDYCSEIHALSYCSNENIIISLK